MVRSSSEFCSCCGSAVYRSLKLTDGSKLFRRGQMCLRSTRTTPLFWKCQLAFDGLISVILRARQEERKKDRKKKKRKKMSTRFRSADINNIMGSARRKKERKKKEKKRKKKNNYPPPPPQKKKKKKKTDAYPGNISQNTVRSDCHEWFQSSQALFSPWKFVGIRSSLLPRVNRVLFCEPVWPSGKALGW